MIAVKLMGGLGNQMFQYALGRQLSILHKSELKLDTSFLLDRSPRENFVYRDFELDAFNIKASMLSKEERNLFFPDNNSMLRRIATKFVSLKNIYSHVKEKHFQFNASVLYSPDNSYLEGYWQSEKYFKPIEEVLRNDFRFKKKVDAPLQEIESKILSSESVCLNVRRADFVNNKHHFLHEVEYFRNASQIMSSKIDSPHYFIFSDDIQWCKENIDFIKKITFVDRGTNAADHLQLMSMCKHFIIPNSTFGWWGAWLSNYQNKIVVAPKTWFHDKSINVDDIIPERWIRI